MNPQSKHEAIYRIAKLFAPSDNNDLILRTLFVLLAALDINEAQFVHDMGKLSGGSWISDPIKCAKTLKMYADTHHGVIGAPNITNGGSSTPDKFKPLSDLCG